jgi:hypothetical protein
MEKWRGGEGISSTCTDGEWMGMKGWLGGRKRADLAWGEGGEPDWERAIMMD